MSSRKNHSLSLKSAAVLVLVGGSMAMSGCNNALEGGASGAAIGALAGMGLGSLSGNMGKGAAAGAITGAVIGGVLGEQNRRSGSSY